MAMLQSAVTAPSETLVLIWLVFPDQKSFSVPTYSPQCLESEARNTAGIVEAA